jgi:hypothetical protein
VPWQAKVESDMTAAADLIDAIKAAKGQESWHANNKHIAALRADPKTAPLADVLARSDIFGLVAQYKAHSETAGRWQTKHKRAAARAAYCGFLAAGVAGTMLYFGASPTSSLTGIALTVVYLVLILIALSSSVYIAIWKPWNEWKSERNAAEKLRIEYFRQIFQSEAPPSNASSSPPLDALTLEFVRAFLMDDQRDWFGRRAGDFEAEVNSRKWWRVFALFLVGAATIPLVVSFLSAPALGDLVPGAVRESAGALAAYGSGLDGKLLALAGVIGAAMQTLATSLAGSSLAERNAVVYRDTAKALKDIAETELVTARHAAETGERALRRSFWTKLSAVLIAEQGGWGDALQTAQLLTLDQLAPLPKAAD